MAVMGLANDVPLKTIRQQLLQQEPATGLAWCKSYAANVDSWIIRMYAQSAGDHSAGLSLLAIGGYGRKELYPYSDLDVLLVHRSDLEVAKIADTLWYPIWDQGIKLDHAVRTPEMVVSTARDDPRALLGLLDARHLAGDHHLSRKVIESVRQLWHDSAPALLPGINTEMAARHGRFGDLAFLLEPDLKESRGGLRDITTLYCLARSDPYLSAAVNMHRVQMSHELLAKIRLELHRISSRPEDCLRQQDQEQVASSLPVISADELMSAVADAGRVTTTNLDAVMRRMNTPEPSRRHHVAKFFSLSKSKTRGATTEPDITVEPIEPGISLSGVSSGTGFRYKEITLSPEVAVSTSFDADTDASLPFRIAAVSAERSIPLSLSAVKAISAMHPPAGWTWPEAVLMAFVRLLRAGAEAITVLEILDQENVICNYIPEWDMVRNLRQHNAYHRYTVDRHLLETAVRAAAVCPGNASGSTRHMLVAAALLHDIGKGMPGDHSRNGAKLARRISIRMGFTEPSVSTIVTLVRHHLLLPDLATRRDIHDPVTSEKVITAFPEPAILELAEILAKADGEATGPLAWGPWKEGLVHDLVLHTRSLMEITASEDPEMEDHHRQAGSFAPGVDAASASAMSTSDKSRDNAPEDPVEQDSSGIRGGADRGSGKASQLSRQVEQGDVGRACQSAWTTAATQLYDGWELVSPDVLSAPPLSLTFIEDPLSNRVMVKTPDVPGILSAVAGVFALRGIDIRSADISSIGNTAIDSFAVEMRIGDWPDWGAVAEDIGKALEGGLALDDLILAREQVYNDPSSRHSAPGSEDTRIEIDTEASAAYSVLEVHTRDSIGLLYRLTKVLFDFEIDVARARVSTIGDQVVDAFYIDNEQLHAAMKGGSLKDRLEKAILEAASASFDGDE
ncbi:MAG: ACT domain-containing protein [Acidimicrobiales bacterium]